MGLGKTIEAGLILRELLMRQKGRRLVMACLSSVVFQRRDEPENRFGLPGVVFDQAYLLIVKTHAAGGLIKEAEAMRRIAITAFKVPAELLNVPELPPWK